MAALGPTLKETLSWKRKHRAVIRLATFGLAQVKGERRFLYLNFILVSVRSAGVNLVPREVSVCCRTDTGIAKASPLARSRRRNELLAFEPEFPMRGAQ